MFLFFLSLFTLYRTQQLSLGLSLSLARVLSLSSLFSPCSTIMSRLKTIVAVLAVLFAISCVTPPYIRATQPNPSLSLSKQFFSLLFSPLSTYVLGIDNAARIEIDDVENIRRLRSTLNTVMTLNSYSLPSLESEVKTEAITLNGVRVLVHRPLSHTGDAAQGSASAQNQQQKGEELPKALVWFHGGGFTVGTADIDIRLASGLARDSARVVFNVEYRLAPENPFPAALEDAAAVVRAVVDQAEKLGVSDDDMATAGRSAGGNLATAVFHQLLMDNATAHYVAHFKRQVLLVPATHSSCPTCYASSEAFAHGYGLTRSLRTAFTRFYAGRGDEEILRDPRFSPMLADQATLAQLPCTLVAVAEADVLRDEGLAYATRLELAGVQVQTRIMKGCVHTDLDRATLDAMAEFLRA